PPRGARMIPAAGTWPVTVLSRRIGDYLALAKPRVVLMVLVTTLVGYYLGSAGTPRLGPLLQTLVGTALAAAGTLALNQLVERDAALLAGGRRARRAAAGGGLGGGAWCARARAMGALRDHVLLADPALARDRPPVPRGLRARGHPAAARDRPRRAEHRDPRGRSLPRARAGRAAADADRSRRTGVFPRRAGG